MEKTAYWNICRKKGFNVPKKWQDHKLLPCTENEYFKIFLDYNIQTDHISEHRRQGMIIVDKTNTKVQIVDFVVPAGHRIEIFQQGGN